MLDTQQLNEIADAVEKLRTPMHSILWLDKWDNKFYELLDVGRCCIFFLDADGDVICRVSDDSLILDNFVSELQVVKNEDAHGLMFITC
jgi:hypothetical protein